MVDEDIARSLLHERTLIVPPIRPKVDLKEALLFVFHDITWESCGHRWSRGFVSIVLQAVIKSGSYSDFETALPAFFAGADWYQLLRIEALKRGMTWFFDRYDYMISWIAGAYLPLGSHLVSPPKAVSDLGSI